MNGADSNDAPVASTIPIFPSFFVKCDIKNKNPNFGILLNPIPIIRGHKPDKHALTGLFLKTLFAYNLAFVGSIAFPDKSVANY